MGLSSRPLRLEGISSLKYNIIPSPLESRSNLKGVLNPSVKKFQFGKISSILVSQVIKISILISF